MAQPYDIVVKKSVLKDLRRIPGSILKRLREKIVALAHEPFPSGSEPIQGYDNHYRMRLGNYRIIYQVATTIRIITIVKVGHRKDVYERL